jgi:CHAT domain-containing protein
LFGLREIQQQVLDPDTILLEYALGSERSFLWLVTPDSLASYALPKRQDIESVSRRVSEQLTARQPVTSETEKQYRARVAAADAQYPKDVAALSEMLLGKIGSELGKKRLLIVADGALQYIPFAALSLPGSDHPLIVDHEIVNLPSASVLATLRRDTAQRAPADNSVAVLADPVFDASDPRVKAMHRDHSQRNGERSKGIDLQRALRGSDLGRLPFSRREADAIVAAASAGSVTQLVDFDANRELAIGGKLSRYRIVHFATHALLNGEHPELSGIVLSLVDKEGRSRDGYVRLHDIYNLNLPAELVVLSACKTALGKEIRGEGLIGLTRGFMYAGTRRVVASLWKVDDWRTAELMKRFYMKMLVDKKSPAAALKAAQIEMWRQPKWRAPYYWAGFTLQGEPN